MEAFSGQTNKHKQKAKVAQNEKGMKPRWKETERDKKTYHLK